MVPSSAMGARIPNGRMAPMPLPAVPCRRSGRRAHPGVDMALVTKNALLCGPRPGGGVPQLASPLQRHQGRGDRVPRLSGNPGADGFAPVRPAPRPRAVALPCALAPAAFRQGLLGNLLNPKIAILFTSLLPQFVGPAADLRASCGPRPRRAPATPRQALPRPPLSRAPG